MYATNSSSTFGRASCEWCIYQVYDNEIKIYPNYITCWVFNFKNKHDIYDKSLEMQYLVITGSDDCRTEMV